ncbi:MSHA biogenesis protein MshA [Aliidiomarina taiwanensis]|uniref:MSHA biogenesis protein MshA n=1 Tax=Aliidiomarina taiwanensis TaxID=946228 RepID=A0A432X7L7_9GAMM|nr:prepilin-type N-terminal cleavage/methylation domain-containing protein [Aliidiomarina taiwanensis]RUO42830.1 MSHA biogenesis protein MshA [Aliidiomarina taiwanensis]
MKKQNGFTLIELIIVIVILGILAVTAAPKFFDFSSDARKSTLKGLKAALEGAANIEYAKKAIAGETLEYPEATLAGIGVAAGVSSQDWDFVETVAAGQPIIGFAPKGYNDPIPSTVTYTNIKQCYVTYVRVQPTSSNPASYEIEVEDSEC